MEKHVNKYFGIDLGTTNSVISYGTINAKEQCTTKVADVIVPNGNNNLSSEKIIPSVVEYSDNLKADAVIVGPKAKSSRTYKVVRSVKSLMGSSEFIDIGDVISDKTPAQVSSRILKCLTQKCKIKGDMKDIVVAVPASFPPAAINATKEAMQLAGINIRSDHPVIISEPLAVMYSIWEQKILGEIDEDVISFSKDQNILVFDIGGGTTDVAIFSLKQNENILEMFKHSQQIACSGHTPLAGDDFDMAIAEKMYENAVKSIGKTPKYPHIVKSVLKEFAEQIKKQYTDDVYNDIPREDVEFSVSIDNLFEGYRYDDTFYMEDIEELVEPFLAKHLKIEDATRASELPEKDMKGNIIYPILECLEKAYKKMGNDFKITSIVLNGGMTYFPLIKQRLDEFFDLECITTLNGDLSVAKGAAFFHYCMHAYGVGDVTLEEIVPREIMNSSLSFGLDGSYIYRFAEAGVTLPYKTAFLSDEFYMSATSNKIKLDIFSGEGKFKNLPCELSYRKIFDLNREYKKGTIINFEVEIDELKQLKVKLYVNNDYSKEYVLETKAHSNIEKDDKNAAKIVSKIPTMVLPDNDINLLADLRKNNKRNLDINERCNDIIAKMSSAVNTRDVCTSILKKLDTISNIDDTIVGDLYIIADAVFESFNGNQKNYILEHAKKQFNKVLLLPGLKYNGYVKSKAIQLIYRHDSDNIEFVNRISKSPQFSRYAKSILNKDAKPE